ncbi:MAG: right-handed parallel beta-helix repeat-containing protein [Pirellulales bacterium]
MATSLVLCASVCSLAAFGAGQPDQVARVERGELKEAKASWWGFDPHDSTSALQAAINSHAPRLIVDDLGEPWITRPLFAVSNQEIVFEEGVVVEAKRGAFHGGNDSLLTIREKTNVTLSGRGAILRMHREDYDDPKQYKKAEWRMVLNILSSKNVRVEGLTLALSGGDGIYLGVSKPGVPPEDIVIKDVICDRNYRQGISVISARNLLIENTIMRNTGGPAPAAGIDFEPNHATNELVNCVLRNCISEDNAGCGYAFYLPHLHAASAPLSIRLEKCISRGNSTDFALATGNSETDAVGGKIDVVNCRFEQARGEAIVIRRKAAAGAAVQFQQCTVDSPAGKKPDAFPLSIMADPSCRQLVGGVDFGNLLVIDPVQRSPFDYGVRWNASAGVKTVKGVLTVRHNKRDTTYRLPDDWLRAHPAIRDLKDIPPLSLHGVRLVPVPTAVEGQHEAEGVFFLRQSGTLLLFAQVGEEVSLTLDHAQVGNYSGRTVDVTAVTPSGEKISVGQLPFKTRTEVKFRASETGIYRLEINIGSNRLGVVKSSHPLAVTGTDRAIHFIGVAGTFYFLVPAGTTRFGLIVYGEGRGEAVMATVFDPAGNQVWQKKRITLPEMFSRELQPAERDQVWRLQLSRPAGIACEDYYVDIRGIPPLLARNPRGLLKPEQQQGR